MHLTEVQTEAVINDFGLLFRTVVQLLRIRLLPVYGVHVTTALGLSILELLLEVSQAPD